MTDYMMQYYEDEDIEYYEIFDPLVDLELFIIYSRDPSYDLDNYFALLEEQPSDNLQDILNIILKKNNINRFDKEILLKCVNKIIELGVSADSIDLKDAPCEVLKIFVDNGIEVNRYVINDFFRTRKTLLDIAILQGCIEKCNLLVEKGARITHNRFRYNFDKSRLFFCCDMKEGNTDKEKFIEVPEITEDLVESMLPHLTMLNEDYQKCIVNRINGIYQCYNSSDHIIKQITEFKIGNIVHSSTFWDYDIPFIECKSDKSLVIYYSDSENIDRFPYYVGLKSDHIMTDEEVENIKIMF